MMMMVDDDDGVDDYNSDGDDTMEAIEPVAD